ncbi:unnamed protein product, partial [marine sediment metagenome]
MTEKTFSISEAAGYGVRTTFKHYGFFLLLLLILAAVGTALAFIAGLILNFTLGSAWVQTTREILSVVEGPIPDTGVAAAQIATTT